MSVPRSLVSAWAGGEIALSDLLAVPRDSLTAIRALAARSLEVGDRRRAADLYRGLATLDPSDVDATVGLATLSLEDGAAELATAWIDRTLAVRPDARLSALRVRAERAVRTRRT